MKSHEESSGRSVGFGLECYALVDSKNHHRCFGQRSNQSRRVQLTASLMLAILAASPPTVGAEPFKPVGGMLFDDLIATVQSAPDMRAMEREERVRDAARQQSHLWPNPTLDATWGTIPIGRTNPEHLNAPLANVPNYRIGLAYTFPLGKRGPIQAVRQAEYESAALRRCSLGRQLALELARVLGDMAEVELRIAALAGLVEAAKEHELNISIRETQQWASGLEVDRATIERGRLEQQLKDAEFDVVHSQTECAALVGRVCESFTSDTDARSYLETWAGFDPKRVRAELPIEQRPDLLALAADERAAQNQLVYYRHLAIPDPTVRIGFVRDQFVVSGAQPSALELTLILPLPIFDWGQAGVRAATASVEGAAAERRARVQLSEAVLPSLKERWSSQRKRREQLMHVLIPKAQAVLESVEKAYQTRLLSITDVIQARRTLLELLFEEIEGLADAYSAALNVRMHVAASENEGCPSPSKH